MNILYPVIAWRLLPRMLGIAVMGALVAGMYGVIHDQITFSISEEYFTQFKFSQFAYADIGLSQRGFVGEIGFLATWWVGFFGGWLMARMAVPVWPFRTALRKCAAGFAIMIGAALLAGLVGYILGRIHSPDYSFWEREFDILTIMDIPAFARVGIIHNASYIGGLVGLIGALTCVWRAKRRRKASA